MTQVTLLSLTERIGNKIKKFLINLIREGLTHMIASDAHNVAGRSFHMHEVSEFIASECGMNTFYMFYENLL
jgi:protein-tyrosine phosphatase